jgi:hypothetical protein
MAKCICSPSSIGQPGRSISKLLCKWSKNVSAKISKMPRFFFFGAIAYYFCKSMTTHVRRGRGGEQCCQLAEGSAALVKNDRVKKWAAEQNRGLIEVWSSQKGPKKDADAEFCNSFSPLLLSHNCVEKFYFLQILSLKCWPKLVTISILNHFL